ncbi:MAG: hypothetical protein AAB830_01330, partial [Patescibacteria group bacterium]
ELNGCPSSPCRAKLNRGTGAVTGWARALAGTALSGNWDGWISLSGKNPDYGPVLSNGTFSGYAWGADVVGWVDFSKVTWGGGTCTPEYFCSGSDVYYKNASCSESLYQQCVSGCSGGACLAPPSAQAASFGASNLFGAFTATGHLQIKPLLVRNGDPTWVYWNLDRVSSCAVTGTNEDSWNGSSSGSAGKTSNPIIGQTTYTLSCAALPGASPSSITESQTVNIIPIFQEK